MEGVGDRAFRKAISQIGGMDEAVTEFISVPCNAHVESLSKVYDAKELGPLPLAAQIMGADPHLMASMAQQLEKRGAPRIDINCGCPSNTVTGRGAGSSLLKDPSYLYEVAKAVVLAVDIPVTIKMRSGYEDTSLFKENLLAAEESGAVFITLHPRTKVEGYTPPARWDLIALAKETLNIPVVGNGDILTVQDALHVLSYTRCDALMIGRGAIINPFLFHEIRGHFAGQSSKTSWIDLEKYLFTFTEHMSKQVAERNQVNKMKQLVGFLFKSTPALLEQRQSMLKLQTKEVSAFLDTVLPILKKELFSL
jgi:tRNA-dihydrouridine synthase C